MTTILKSADILENQVTVSYNVTYNDIEKVFTKIKEKGILNEPIVLDGHARYKNDMPILHNRNKRAKNKKRLKKSDKELEL